MQFTDRFLKSLAPPASGNKITYDPATPGLGLRITAAGARAFILNYRIAGRERRYTLGPYGVDQWTLVRARRRAGELRRMIERGEDPLAERQDARTAPTVADLCERFIEEHAPKLRARTAHEYKKVLDTYVLAEMKHLKVAEVGFTHVDRLHRKISKSAPYRANRAVAIVSKMFALAIKWDWAERNPAHGVERNQEVKRTTYLPPDVLAGLSGALAQHHDQQVANILRLLLLTGARRGEVQAARWDQLNLDTGVWIKPGSTTKQKTEHRVPLSEAAIQLLRELRAEADPGAVHVFPAHTATGFRNYVHRDWVAICKAAGISGVRVHDLRHTYASVLASAGLSLPIIGALLGHSQPQTTARYAHLFDDPLRAATERAAAIVTGKPSPVIVELKRGA